MHFGYFVFKKFRGSYLLFRVSSEKERANRAVTKCKKVTGFTKKSDFCHVFLKLRTKIY